jgi:hypothetical protein
MPLFEYHYAVSYYAECHYAQCHYAEYNYVECRGAHMIYCVSITLNLRKNI